MFHWGKNKLWLRRMKFNKIRVLNKLQVKVISLVLCQILWWHAQQNIRSQTSNRWCTNLQVKHHYIIKRIKHKLGENRCLPQWRDRWMNKSKDSWGKEQLQHHWLQSRVHKGSQWKILQNRLLKRLWWVHLAWCKRVQLQSKKNH